MPNPTVHARLKRMLQEQADPTRKLRAIWALHVTGGLTETDLLALLDAESEYVRSWAVSLLVESGRIPRPPSLRRFAALGPGGSVAARASVARERAAARAGRTAMGRR